MRKVTFQEVGMKNFGPYLDPMILNFQNNSLTLMTGPNGIGKTMSLEAVPFTLYGSTNKGAKGDDVVNETVGRNCHTWVKFTIDSDQYEVNRYHKYTKLGNTVILKKNGVETKKGSKEVVPEIERILCPKKSFTNTLMFGQKIKDFFTDLIDSDKKEIFRKILALDNYTLYYKKADEFLRTAAKEITELYTAVEVNKALILNLEVEIMRAHDAKKAFQVEKEKELAELKKTIPENERILERWKKDQDELKSKNHDVESVEKEIIKFNTKLELMNQSYDSKHSKLISQKTLKLAEFEDVASIVKNTALEQYNTESNELMLKNRKDEETIRTVIHGIEVAISDVKSKRSGYASTILMLNSNKKTFEDAISSEEGVCPTCFQDINEDHKDHLRKEAGLINNQVKTTSSKMQQMEVQLNDLLKQKDPQLKELDLLKIAYNKQLEILENNKNEKINEAKSRLDAATSKLDQLFSEQESKLYKDIEDESKSLSETIEVLEAEKLARELFLDSIEECEKTIKKLELDNVIIEAKVEEVEAEEYDESRLNGYNEKIGELNMNSKEQDMKMKALDKRVKILEFWKLAFSSSGIPSMLIDEAIPFMNQTVADYLERMTNGRYIVSFDTLATTKSGEFRDKISVHVIDTHTKATSRIKLSGGQTRIIDIATILTLGDLQSNIQDISFNILFFDEIFDSLDEENIGFVSKVLTKLKSERSIYLISHRHEDQLEADEVLTLN